jgi:hypothetical protein
VDTVGSSGSGAVFSFIYGNGATPEVYANLAPVNLNNAADRIYFRMTVPIAEWANLDETMDASVYIAPASATVDGIVDRSAQTFAGVKTFNDGVKLDDAVGQSILNNYINWTDFTPSVIKGGGSGTLTTAGISYARYMRLGNTVTVQIYASLTVATDTVSVKFTLPVAPLRVMRGIYGNSR